MGLQSRQCTKFTSTKGMTNIDMRSTLISYLANLGTLRRCMPTLYVSLPPISLGSVYVLTSHQGENDDSRLVLGKLRFVKELVEFRGRDWYWYGTRAGGVQQGDWTRSVASPSTAIHPSQRYTVSPFHYPRVQKERATLSVPTRGSIKVIYRLPGFLSRIMYFKKPGLLSARGGTRIFA